MKAYGITLLRLTVGVLYLLHAYRLLIVTTPAETASLVARVTGLPHPTVLAWCVIAAHGLGGLLLVGGILTRAAAAVNALIAAVLLVRVDLAPGFFSGGAEGRWGLYHLSTVGFEYALLLTVATVALLLLGSGPLALRPSK